MMKSIDGPGMRLVRPVTTTKAASFSGAITNGEARSMLDRDFTLHAVGGEAILVAAMMEVSDLRRCWRITSPADFGTQSHLRNRDLPDRVLLHDANRFVDVRGNREARASCIIEEEEHVAGGDRGDQRLLGIDTGLVRGAGRDVLRG